MPIHDQGYRHYTGERLPRGRSWWVIARTGIRTMLGRRAFVALLVASWLPFLVRAVQIYAAANLPQVQFLAPTGETFRQFLGQQQVFIFFVTVYAGAGLVANDRRANALQIYLAKPLTRTEYVVGKLAVLLTFLLFVTWVPAMALLLVQVLFSGSFAFFLGNLHLMPAITLFTFLEALTVGLGMLALSSLSKNSRFVGVLSAAALFFVQAVTTVLRFVLGDSRLAWLSLVNSLDAVGDVIFRLTPSSDAPLILCATMIAAVMAISFLVLTRQVRGVEVIA
jgi:ABC-2 type transport system permease protein